MDSLFSFPVGLFHPLQHAGLSRRTPDRPSSDRYRKSTSDSDCCAMPRGGYHPTVHMGQGRKRMGLER
jgi:hypothetical protein